MALSTIKKLNLHFVFLKTDVDTEFKIFYHNVQSFNKHYQYVISDPNIKNVDFLLFVETWTISNRSFPIENFTEFIRVDSNDRKPCAKGLICYVKTCLYIIHAIQILFC